MKRHLIVITLTFLSIVPFYNKSVAKSHENLQKPNFIFPVICTLGENCWPVNYVDLDQTEGVKDFKCTSKSYNNHKGTDFALASVVDMNKGVDVIAAADGRVLRTRDGETDALKSKADLNAIKDDRKECGNAVLLEHGSGLQTIYCHLKRSSITVRRGDKISAGEKIAQVGQSGLAEFPHLHFGVIWEGAIIDPFTGQTIEQDCMAAENPMWQGAVDVQYMPAAIFDGGFGSKSPDFAAIQRGEDNSKTIGKNSAAFTFWAGFYNVEKGDRITIDITDPNGEEFIITHQNVPKARARQYYFTGRKIGRVQLMNGTYTGTAKLMRQTDNPEQPITLKRTFKVDVK